MPSHAGIHGNEVVDQLAKAALRHDEVNFNVIPSYKALVDVGKKMMLEKWQTMWNNEVKDWFNFAINSQVLFKMKCSENKCKTQTAISRLRFGKSLLSGIMGMFGMRESGLL